MSGPVCEFYKNKNILLTGATGHVGKAIAEKLIRICDVSRVYLLIRPKPGQTTQQRLNTIKNNAIFQRIKTESWPKMNKLEAVNGDIHLKNIGLTESDRECLQNDLDIIIHATPAASVALDTDMKTAIEINLQGTKNVLEFAKNIRHLQGFVHVSTAFVHTGLEKNQKVLEEILVPLPYDEDELLMTIQRLNKNERQRVGPLIRGKYADWYPASKNYAEWVVAQTKNFPRAIVRPTAVSAAWKEPFPGYNDSRNSVAGVVAGAYLGVFRRINTEQSVDEVPVDVVVNTVLVAAWKIATQGSENIEVYQVACGEHKGNYGTLISCINFMRDYPSIKVLWYPNLKIITSPTLFYISYILYQLVPAILFDLILLAKREKPRVLKSQKKYYAMMKKFFRYYSSSKFRFDNKNLTHLQELVPPMERQIFYMDLNKIDWRLYYKDLVLGVRRYLLHDKDTNIVKARWWIAFFRISNFFTEIAFYALIWLVVSASASCSLITFIWLPVLLFILVTVYL